MAVAERQRDPLADSLEQTTRTSVADLFVPLSEPIAIQEIMALTGPVTDEERDLLDKQTETLVMGEN